jgi:hypothetical protein
MQFTAAAFALFATVVSATTTTVQFTNDASGRSANVVVPLAITQSVSTLLKNTPLDVNNTFLATSFFLQANFQGVECDLILPSYLITINDRHTFAGFAPVSAPLDLAHANLQCFSVV